MWKLNQYWDNLPTTTGLRSPVKPSYCWRQLRNYSNSKTVINTITVRALAFKTINVNRCSCLEFLWWTNYYQIKSQLFVSKSVFLLVLECFRYQRFLLTSNTRYLVKNFFHSVTQTILQLFDFKFNWTNPRFTLFSFRCGNKRFDFSPLFYSSS